MIARACGLCAILVLPALVLSSCGGERTTTTPRIPHVPSAPTTATPPRPGEAPGPNPTPPPSPAPALPVTLVGAGDIAVCGTRGAEATARLLDGIPGMIFTVGDLAYPDGTERDFQQCYEPTWGRHKWRTRPSPGNHDYNTGTATAYFNYFGPGAGPAGLGYYSYQLGDWYIASLNSNIPAANGSPQIQWLRAELEMNASRCSLAYWHHPLFTSGPNGDSRWMRDMWRVLYEAGVDVILAGHDHLYERFAPQDPDGRHDPARGIRQFIVGTGGAPGYQVRTRRPNSEVHSTSLGVLKLTLSSDQYSWEFVPAAGESFRDFGSAPCH